MSNLIEVKVPDIGGSTDVNVAEIYIKVGDTIKKDDNLLMLETDKATMEVPSEVDAIVKEITIKVGSKINEGDVIAKVELTDKKDVSKPEVLNDEKAKKDLPVQHQASISKSPTQIKDEPQQSDSSKKIDEERFSTSFASPSIRKLARELGVDLSKIQGSGPKGRITDEDLKNFVKDIVTTQGSIPNNSLSDSLNLLPWPKVDFAKFGAVEVKSIARIKKISGANLARNWVMIPHVTQFDEADITELEEFRKKLNTEYKSQNIKITPLAFLIKACVFALKKFPEFNSSIDGDNLVYKKYFNIGFAADTPNGLVVPVLKDVDKMGVKEIAIATANLAKLAREGMLKPTDMQGGSFTISSLGGIGGTAFTPIINAPEVAILGVSKSIIKPVYNGSDFLPKLMLPLSVSYDHRIIDGALAAHFSSYLSEVLKDIRRLVL